MDTIKELISQKFGSASEVIKANSEADAKSLKEAKSRIEELEKAVSDMRRLSLKCAETNELTAQLVQSAIEKLEETNMAGVNAEDEDKAAEIKAAVEQLQAVKESIEAAFKAQEEVIHKENVRVYRNVQASIVDELKQQSEAIAAQHVHLEKKFKGIKPMSILALIFSSITMVAVIAELVIYLITSGIL